jgi:hypothetical protein
MMTLLFDRNCVSLKPFLLSTKELSGRRHLEWRTARASRNISRYGNLFEVPAVKSYELICVTSWRFTARGFYGYETLLIGCCFVYA